MNIKKITLLATNILTVAVMTFSPAVALAATNDTTVVNSGDDAKITTNATQSTNVRVNNDNTANVTQTVNASSNTGFNSADDNIGGGSVKTGSANVGVAMDVAVNKNVTAISGLDTGGTNNTDIVNTGDNLEVETDTSSNTRVTVNNDNNARVTQSCGDNNRVEVLRLGNHNNGCSANTGFNSADSNIGGGSVDTGNAGVGVEMGAAVNKNTTLIGGSSNGNGSSHLMNALSVVNTGDDADIDADASRNTRVTVNNNNRARVNQTVHAFANSGFNSADDNIGGGSVDTGNAGVGVSLGVKANSNLTGIDLGWGSHSMNLNEIVNTGDDFEAETETTSRLRLVGDNNNSLTQLQNLFARSTSGWNSSESNIGGGDVDSGNTGTGGEFFVLSNSNQTWVGFLLSGLLDFMDWL